MYLGLDASLMEAPSRALSEQQIRGLARTFDRVADPVWVEDSRGLRLYANNAAGTNGTAESTSWAFEILDHADRIVGRLRTVGR